MSLSAMDLVQPFKGLFQAYYVVHVPHLFGSADVPLLHCNWSCSHSSGLCQGRLRLDSTEDTTNISFPHLHDVKARMQWPLPVSLTSMLISSVCVLFSCTLA